MVHDSLPAVHGREQLAEQDSRAAGRRRGQGASGERRGTPPGAAVQAGAAAAGREEGGVRWGAGAAAGHGRGAWQARGAAGEPIR